MQNTVIRVRGGPIARETSKTKSQKPANVQKSTTGTSDLKFYAQCKRLPEEERGQTLLICFYRLTKN